ncbi:MAG TPA: glucose-6-phosphate isomerase [Thiotrichaceae bacterium]|jgi:glucose-6-phosphate isomerase|nr:glucose-6-phosphate isomerase [Thiotrichaceae bacterium]HIM07782.1 glucose-6-phosphate isomerase [Gammaproteobacteria bacterium]
MSTSSEKHSISEQLATHYQAMRNIHMRDLFMHDKQRGNIFSRQFSELYIDYSKNLISTETLDLLFNFAKASSVENSIKAMFNGEKINVTENRAVLHTALRSPVDKNLKVDGVDIIKQVHSELEKIKQFVVKVHEGSFKGWTGKTIDTFVNIGIGGSDLGPKMVVDALAEYRHANTRSFFISNVDYQSIAKLQKEINPETTLFIISSKSFSTQETLMNADTLKKWMQKSGCTDINKHFIAVSNNLQATKEFGIDSENVFEIWDWVGGRFSLWSAIGLPIALAIGFDNFKSLLAGAREMDEHFLRTPMEENIPVILALIDYWYSNYFDAHTQTFVPYDESLKFFPDYLSQLFMESNGKSSDLSGCKIDYKTMPIIWGSTGANSQHAFFQLLHQGTQMVPVEFLAPLSKKGESKHHALLLANCFAQAQALMQGEDNTDLHKHFPGNKPSTTILYSELNPKTLGSLLAMYEHRTFVQGLLWQINSFDQWGVELGKKLVVSIHENLISDTTNKEMDSSTKKLVELYKKARQ